MLNPELVQIPAENGMAINALLANGADSNVNIKAGVGLVCPRTRGKWPMMVALDIAFLRGNLPMVETLLDSGAKVNAEGRILNGWRVKQEADVTELEDSGEEVVEAESKEQATL
ncbi:hypothetical protein MKZ38_009038 [Zalerion maritima]|uniref:Ankyrin repeat protein n=1 Tax=Zalerion maritima TaxID=339359 RepID=A0AAD5RVQ4_9PEZI|nr:hypothetical protein MKZ38_009038 [Zalerion maritima]